MNPFRNMIPNLFLQADEQKEAGEFDSQLNFLRSKKKDVRDPITEFSGKYCFLSGQIITIFQTENEQGNIEYRKQHGTA